MEPVIETHSEDRDFFTLKKGTIRNYLDALKDRGLEINFSGEAKNDNELSQHLRHAVQFYVMIDFGFYTGTNGTKEITNADFDAWISTDQARIFSDFFDKHMVNNPAILELTPDEFCVKYKEYYDKNKTS